MIDRLFLHLQEDTHAKKGVVYAYKKTGIPHIDANESGIEAAKDLIVANKPQVIVIHDEPEFMKLVEDVADLSPQSLNIINKSIYEGTGIKIRKKSDYERLKELDFVIYRSGFDLNNLCGELKKYNNGEFRRSFMQWAFRVEPFDALNASIKEKFKYNYYFI